MHQGGYYQFKYDITKLLKFGQENLLEVTVDDESANASVNGAERRGDYWNYGGIFRPVYLAATPMDSIDRVAINAKADGSLTADVAVDAAAQDQNGTTAWSCEGQILDMEDKPVGASFAQNFPINDGKVQLTAKLDSPRLWTAETPNLYQAEFRLKDQTGAVIHSIR
jgi:beta-galactosidase/beta-glucuronidase